MSKGKPQQDGRVGAPEDRDTFYRLTYPVYCKYFKAELKNGARRTECMERAVALVSTWMGRESGRVKTVSLNGHANVRAAIQALCVARPRESEFEQAFNEIQRFVGGSPVATSKFLHFLRPSRYPIWDSNVSKAYQVKAGITIGNAYKIKAQQYEQYRLWLRRWNPTRSAERMVSRYHKGARVSSVRRKELALFMLGRKLAAT